MRVGDYELRILGVHGDARRETGEGHVPLRHGDVYSLEIGNHSGDTVNLDVRIDGASVGRFQLAPHRTSRLERPAEARGRFTFFAAGTAEAQQVGEAAVASPDRGLVQVEFVPEARRPPVHRTSFGHLETLGSDRGPVSYGGGITRSMGLAPGVTGMSGTSGQEFGRAWTIDEDRARAVTITLRLVHDTTATATAGPQPLPGRSAGNPVPRPVG